MKKNGVYEYPRSWRAWIIKRVTSSLLWPKNSSLTGVPFLTAPFVAKVEATPFVESFVMPFFTAVVSILDESCMSASGSRSVDADESNFIRRFSSKSRDCSRGRFRGLGDSGGSSRRALEALRLVAADLGDVKLLRAVLSPGLLKVGCKDAGRARVEWVCERAWSGDETGGCGGKA